MKTWEKKTWWLGKYESCILRNSWYAQLGGTDKGLKDFLGLWEVLNLMTCQEKLGWFE